MKSQQQTFSERVFAELPFSPNSDQQHAVEALASFVCNTGERSAFVLQGYAGTGKTQLVAAITRALPSIRWRSVLLAPTGRAAKVLALYARRPAQTIHRKIYRKLQGEEGEMLFALADNLHRQTLFIVDEASMIGGGSEGGNLLDNLFEYVFSGDGCKLVLIGDAAQLPPVGSDLSPALDVAFLRGRYHIGIMRDELRTVARQRDESGILFNATAIRVAMLEGNVQLPLLTETHDVCRVHGGDLEGLLHDALKRYGDDGVIIVTRSNRRATQYNAAYRNLVRSYESDLSAGDRLMVVKNNYHWLGDTGFIANGDMAEVVSIRRRESLYGLNFCDCALRMIDYPELGELNVKIITDTLHTDDPALSQESQKQLYQQVLQEAADAPTRAMRLAFVRENPYYNALQVKFAYAVTCHKAQGGQWPAVFIDQGAVQQHDVAWLRWLYTALTRASETAYLLGFPDEYFIAP